MTTIRAVKGMNDILPTSTPTWQRIEAEFWAHARAYGYGEVRTPVVEPTALFRRSIGEATDIVEKEMYTFVDKGDHSLTLRPEGTASAVRAYVQHSVHATEPVTKWAYLGPMFRRERPARGRYRQFWQAGVEIFGDRGPFVDAEMIDMVVTFFRSIGVSDVEVLVNSLGTSETRERYVDRLKAFLTPHADALSEDSRRRLATNPLRILDSKAPADQEIAARAPTIVDDLSVDDREHLEALESTLKALGTPFRREPRLVRGLDYYNRTLFEVQGRGGELGAQNTLCGGGRYDGLVRSLGGPDTPAIGFAMGLERLLLVLGEGASRAAPDVFLVIAQSELRTEGSVLLKELREAGLNAEADLRGQSLKSQMRRADKSGTRFALVLGTEEVAQGVVQVKDLQTHGQLSVARADLSAHLVEALANAKPAETDE